MVTALGKQAEHRKPTLPGDWTQGRLYGGGGAMLALLKRSKLYEVTEESMWGFQMCGTLGWWLRPKVQPRSERLQ